MKKLLLISLLTNFITIQTMSQNHDADLQAFLDNRLYEQTANNNVASMQRLIDYGANVNATRFNDGAPLHLATLKGHTAAMQILITNGAHVDAKDWSGSTPLLWAIQPGHIKAIQILMSNQADVTATDSQGYTAIQLARETKNVEAEKILTKHNKLFGQTIKKAYQEFKQGRPELLAHALGIKSDTLQKAHATPNQSALRARALFESNHLHEILTKLQKTYPESATLPKLEMRSQVTVTIPE